MIEHLYCFSTFFFCKDGYQVPLWLMSSGVLSYTQSVKKTKLKLADQGIPDPRKQRQNWASRNTGVLHD